MPLALPDNAPFTGTQRMWLSGYLAGLSSAFAPAAPVSPIPATAGAPVHIIWGSQTGNAEGLAKRLAKTLAAAGHPVTVADMADLSPANLVPMKNLVVIASTYGDGEPPDNAAALHASLGQPSGRSLAEVRFAVLALGDSNYPDFCKCGHDFHRRLTERGATPWCGVTETDVDFDEAFEGFAKRISAAVASAAPA